MMTRTSKPVRSRMILPILIPTLSLEARMGIAFEPSATTTMLWLFPSDWARTIRS